jgi:FKBP-type peptidyl-prolyl cis-trans isomerase
MIRTRILVPLLLCLLAPALLRAADAPPAKASLEDPKARLGYALGLDIGTRLKEIQNEFDLAAFQRGVDDYLKGAQPALTPQEAAQVRQDFMKRYQEAQAQKMKEVAEKNLKQGEEFLAANKAKPGVVTTDSGLQFQILKEGTGATPGPKDKVTVHYKGQLLDGTVFDSSFDRGQPATFPLGGVIKGWTEGLQHVKEGGSARLVIPPALAYGERGAGQKIGPNSTLIFDVELVKIEPAPAAATPPPPPASAPPAPGAKK